MDHEETREQLELAALEPGGLDRLMAGDTPRRAVGGGPPRGLSSRARTELGRLRRSSAVLRSDLREMPPPDLKARTLAAIRAEGVQRPLVAASRASPYAAGRWRRRRGDDHGRRGHEPEAAPGAWSTFAMVATIAAAVVLSVVTTSLIVGSRVDDQLAQQSQTIDGLEDVTTTTLTSPRSPTPSTSQLAGVSDPSSTGRLVYSPATTELVVVATGLTEPAPGYEYRCWVEVGGKRERIGRMFFGDELAYWAGAVAGDRRRVEPHDVRCLAGRRCLATALDSQPVLVGSST